MELTDSQIQRYSRHIILNEVGGKGQKKLANAKILLIGAGGLGSPAALYLAAAGIGTIGLVDGDVVDLSNLQRQIMHSTATLGQPKVESGRKMLWLYSGQIISLGGKEFLLSSAVDITGQKQMEQQLRVFLLQSQHAEQRESEPF